MTELFGFITSVGLFCIAAWMVEKGVTCLWGERVQMFNGD